MPNPDEVPDRSDRFSAAGHPIHTRALEIEIFQDERERLRATGPMSDPAPNGSQNGADR